MISIAGSAGPLGALIAYIMIGSMVFFLMTSLGEMATLIPTAGSFTTYATCFVDPALGFVTVAAEIAAAALILQFWVSSDALPAWVWSIIFLAFMSVHMASEYWFSIIKVLTVIIFIIVGILVDAGVVGGDRIGFRNWTLPGAPVVNGFGGILSVFLIAGFSFQGTELVGVAAGESENPRKNVPKAIKQVFGASRVSVMSRKTAVAVFHHTCTSKSLKPASHIMNAVILITVMSAGNSGMPPAFFSRVNSRGIPMHALVCTTVVSALCFGASLLGSGEVYYWLLNISSVAGFIAWLGIALSHFRFRRAYIAQGGDISHLPYRAAMFPFGPLYALLLCMVVVLGQGYSELTCYIGLPFFLCMYLGYKIYYKTKVVPLMECDFGASNLENGDINHPHEHCQ
ncbi:amino acid permease/ SLC12A domain-containing protein [Lobosporangium transversale]|uniref:Amino acid permease/ SLC12A domain-containing protein n=1 Tax=Lobosporangium transversale TaxID=64571 RepID=A0A1Y2GIG0_9FUNG|nr:amino acid permease/ SLC12A domain-containing protein [Lobosporangium transversale]ORZ11734.1 amino acid permease/ SLC12A domain-containing protein [Lobosporangium transversale]|eukprot:XP_021879831.1 amino acid permease/ SLC12A domain-containing protein [Lobosporangium transversale]